MFSCEILGKFTSFIFWNFEISLVSLARFQNFKKVNSVNLSEISLLNMWLLVQTLIAADSVLNDFLFEAQKYFIALNSIFIFNFMHNGISALVNVLKLGNENENVVSTLSNVVNINVEIGNVDFTLSDVAMSYPPNNNVETTLKCFLNWNGRWWGNFDFWG